VFNSGILAGGDTFDYLAAPPGVVTRVDRLRAVCARWDVPLTAVAVQFPGRHPAVACVLVGCRSEAELAADVGDFELELPAGLWDELA
jgi:D-threo-aldose 1-dehydrogenase